MFCNPKAEDDYTVTLYSRCIRGIRDELGLNPDFILYSTRSCFVNEGDLQGGNPFDLAMITGRNLERARCYYVRS